LAVKQRMDKKLQKPLLVYDADCGFCIYWVDRWRKITGDKIDYAPYQEVASRFSSIPIKKFQKAAALILPSGKVLWGAKAVLRALASNPKKFGSMLRCREHGSFLSLGTGLSQEIVHFSLNL